MTVVGWCGRCGFIQRQALMAKPEEVRRTPIASAVPEQRQATGFVRSYPGADLDLHVGGTFFCGFRGPKVPETWALWQFTEVEARIAITVTLARHAGIGRGTLLTLSSTPLDASDAELAAFREAMSSMEMGWGQTLESLAGFLSAAR